MIAHERHFGRAAQRLGMRQPPLSQGLKRLETELGVRLCDRDSQGVSLTDAGRALLPAALRVLDEVEQLRLLARRHDEPARPRIEVRVAPGLGASHYATLVATLHRTAPDADVNVTEQATADQIQDLLAGRADIGILREPVVARDLSLGPQIRVPLNCLVPADHPGISTGRVRLRELAGHQLVLSPRQQAPAAYDDVIAICERHGFLPDTVRDVADDRLTRGLVASGSYVSFTTDSPGGDAESGVVVPIEGAPLSMTFRLAWPRDLRRPLDNLPDAVVAALTKRDVGESAPPTGGPPRAALELPAIKL